MRTQYTVFTKHFKYFAPSGITNIKKISDEALDRFKEEWKKVMTSPAIGLITFVKNDEMTFHRLKAERKHFRATFVAVLDTTGRYFAVGISEWNPEYKQPFNKKKGIEIARDNAITRPFAMIDTSVIPEEQRHQRMLENMYRFAEEYESMTRGKYRAYVHKHYISYGDILKNLKFA